MQQERQSWGIAVWVALAWMAAALVSKAFAHAVTESLPVWLASAVTFCALALVPRWNWLPVLLGAAVAMAAWGAWAHKLGLVASLAFAAIELVSMALGAWVATLGQRPDDTPGTQTPARAGMLIAGALAASLVGALLAIALWHWQRPASDPWAEGLAWFCSTGLGILLVAPLAFSFAGFRVRRSGGMPMSQFVAGALAFAVFAIIALLVFGGRAELRFGALASTLAYLPMPFLLLSALLWGLRGGSFAMLGGSLLMIGLTANGGGPFAIREDFPGEAVVEVQGFIAVWAVVMLLASALAEGRRAALASARDWQLRFERTLQAVGAVTVEYDAVTGRAVWSDGAARVLGPSVAGVGGLDEWLDGVDPSERAMVKAAWESVAEGHVPASEHDYAVRLPDGRSLRVRERLAGVQGADGRVETVAGLMRAIEPEAALG